ncbi:hypothetical protein BU23DRAFT_575084 [Bimuria novae-zelandiae CBS 107.79]|uniref:BTB domain-containing protein n=1 Tax=Bimuria novae-zelandiae CBS 107.79 TaxID=1447943 RepID=A0A6A5UK22_9PLEO|nr:hypothetical protein BU23DRAFT_575084 [Bimuria novae-zelandiae CBS 107.79]
MATASTTSTGMFDNPLFSDIKIRQTRDGVTKEYHAHKAVLCAVSPWFLGLFTGIQDVDIGVATMPGDDPQDFEAMLRYIYTQELKHPGLDRNVYWDGAEMKINYLLDIHAIADKYEVRGLQACASEHFPLVHELEEHEFDVYFLELIVETHYRTCIDNRCSMGRRICGYILKREPDFIKTGRVGHPLLKAWPKFTQDLLEEALENNGGRLC